MKQKYNSVQIGLFCRMEFSIMLLLYASISSFIFVSIRKFFATMYLKSQKKYWEGCNSFFIISSNATFMIEYLLSSCDKMIEWLQFYAFYSISSEIETQ